MTRDYCDIWTTCCFDPISIGAGLTAIGSSVAGAATAIAPIATAAGGAASAYSALSQPKGGGGGTVVVEAPEQSEPTEMPTMNDPRAQQLARQQIERRQTSRGRDSTNLTGSSSGSGGTYISSLLGR